LFISSISQASTVVSFTTANISLQLPPNTADPTPQFSILSYLGID